LPAPDVAGKAQCKRLDPGVREVLSLSKGNYCTGRAKIAKKGPLEATEEVLTLALERQ